MLLSKPLLVQDFPAKVRQFDRWLQELVAHDSDASLYLMFQLAATSFVGYSASHALVCGTLGHILAQELQLPVRERNALVRAALTMNIGMTALQNQLAEQRERPNAAQQQAIRSHPHTGHELLERLFIIDALWLDTVDQHHQSVPERVPLAELSDVNRLTRILGTIDRYAAQISPRKSRPGRSATESLRALIEKKVDQRDEIGYALVRAVGLCPPGTFVRLDNGDTAIVLRRSDKANLPLVASLLNSAGELLDEPHLHQTAEGKPRIQSALARTAVTVELNHRTMVRLGSFAAQPSVGLVTQRGTL
jgi:HD-GYP domain-containing protein (c-di-GMP phosphodiesterase class II)